MIDTPRHKGLRNVLVKELISKGIEDEKVLSAIARVPRHLFLSSGFERQAYQDIAYPIIAGQTISRPSTVAFQTQLLQVEKEQKVLEIGTGSGYQTAVLVAMGAIVYTIERQNALFKKAKLFLPKIHLTPREFIFGDGYLGSTKNAPFDRIIVTAGAPEVPEKLLEQLAIGGRMVVPIGENEQIMTLFERISENQYRKTEHGTFAFVPMLERTALGKF